MIPDGFFKVWVNNEDELMAVCRELEAAGIHWNSGSIATSFKPDVIPAGLEIGYRAFHHISPDRQISYDSDFDEWKSNEHFAADIYSVADIVCVPTVGDCKSVLQTMLF